MISLLQVVIFLFVSVAEAREMVKGEWIESRRSIYRYVSVYDVQHISQKLEGFPWISEDCHDDGDRFANWSKTVAYERTYEGTLNLTYLGFGIDLGGSSSRTFEYTFERWVHATKGIRARHVLYEDFENWIGESHVEYLGPDGSVTVGTKKYPFSLKRQNYGLVVKRERIEQCQ